MKAEEIEIRAVDNMISTPAVPTLGYFIRLSGL
jgi:hypothetical protein